MKDAEIFLPFLSPGNHRFLAMRDPFCRDKCAINGGALTCTRARGHDGV